MEDPARRALDTFAEAFSFGKSQYYPYPATCVDGIWFLRDNPPRKKQRTSEVMALDRDPKEVVASIEAFDPGWHVLCDARCGEVDQKSIDKQYKDLGYRKHSTEWLFDHDLTNLPNFESEPKVRLITSQEHWNSIPQRASQPRKLRDGYQLFGIYDEASDFGWVESLTLGTCGYVAGLYVFAEQRRLGYGAALMSALLKQNKMDGLDRSVLVASTAGSKLYPRLGYRCVATLVAYTPTDRTKY